MQLCGILTIMMGAELNLILRMLKRVHNLNLYPSNGYVVARNLSVTIG